MHPRRSAAPTDQERTRCPQSTPSAACPHNAPAPCPFFQDRVPDRFPESVSSPDHQGKQRYRYDKAQPITDDAVVRSAWGLARARLLASSKVVVIGFSGAPTDFYTSWLLRSTIGTREGVEIVVINPSNREDDPNHQEFTRRMASIFLRGYDPSLYHFSQIDSVL